MKQKRFACVFLCFISAFLIPVCAFAADSVPQKILDVRPSVVRIVAENAEGIATGTGFSLGVDRVLYIATNYHVVADTNSIKVLYGSNGSATASIAAKLSGSDLCVLKLDDPISGMVPMTIDDKSDTKPGDAVYALGFPGGADTLFSSDITGNPNDVTVTNGIVSSLRSSTMVSGGNEVGLYQINVAINPGNSGGPLLNEAGEVIGINSYASTQAQSVNAAIRINELVSLLKQNNISYRTAGGIWFFVIWAAVAAGAAAAVVFILRRVRRNGKVIKGKKQSLETWLAKANGKIPFDMALYMLEPVVQSLSAMHASGMSRLDIGIDNVCVQISGKAELTADKRKNAASGQILKPGFAAPEQYKAGGDIGPWCDVYALGALLYRLVIGKPLPDAFSRMEYDADVQQDIAERNIDENKKSAWLRALSLKPEERFHNCGMLAEAIYAQSFSNSADSFAQQSYDYNRAQARKLKKPLDKRLVPLIIAGALAILTGGYFGFMEYTYQQAAQLTQDGDYQMAVDNLAKLPASYRDAQTLDNYDYAFLLLKQSNFDKAKEWFRDLGGYRDSATMVTEVEYRRAKNDMANGNWDAAKNEFTALEDYKDSQTMVMEVDYEHAANLAKQNDVLNAYLLFKTIPNYSDVPNILPTFEEAVYQQAVIDYQNEYSPSEAFAALSGYKDANAYLTLIQAKSSYSSGDEATYQQLLKLVGFADAVDVIMSDLYIDYYLKGNWSDGAGNYFWMDEKKYTNYNMPRYDDGKYYKIEDAIYKIGPANAENTNVLKFTFVSVNEMVIYDYKNNRMYDMFRE